jgi:hypothetical protein
MAKKSTTETKEKIIEEVIEEVKVESPAIAEEARVRTIISNTPGYFRRAANIEANYIVGEMPAGIAFEIEKEVSSRIYGEFYLLKNGYYITKSGNYSIN